MNRLSEWIRGWITTWVIRIFEPELYRALIAEFDLTEFEEVERPASLVAEFDLLESEAIELGNEIQELATCVDFDRYMKERGLGPKDGPAALAAWLHEAYGWDGDVRKIDP